MQLHKDSEKNCIVYGETLSISDIHTQQNIYREALAAGKNIILQASAIQSIDTPSLQLLLSFFLAAKQQKISCHWKHSSDTLYNAACLLGMEHLLGLSEASSKLKPT